jgi:hypothetical protein
MGERDLSIPVPAELTDIARFRAKQGDSSSDRRLQLLASFHGDPDLDAGWDMGPPSAVPDVRGKPHDEAVDLMVQWFFENFEDPADHTPWDEGAYVYIWGGPHQADEELTEAFTEAASDAAITAAIIQIECEGYEWAPSTNRHCPEAPSSPIAAAKQRLVARIRSWCAGADENADPAGVEVPFAVEDVAALLRDHYQQQTRKYEEDFHE